MAMGRLPITKSGSAIHFSTFCNELVLDTPETTQTVVTVCGRCAAGSSTMFPCENYVSVSDVSVEISFTHEISFAFFPLRYPFFSFVPFVRGDASLVTVNIFGKPRRSCTIRVDHRHIYGYSTDLWSSLDHVLCAVYRHFVKKIAF